MFDLFGNINKLRNIHSDSEKKKIAKLLQTTPEALEEFEKAYHLGVLEEPVSDNLFEVNAKQAAGMNDHITVDDSEVESLIDRIVTELLSETTFFKYEDGTVSYGDFGIPFPEHPVTKEEILSLPESLRPQLSGTLLKKELNGDSYPGILSIYKEYLKEKNPQKKKMTYDIFRQGLEIQDLDPITYQIIAKNKNSIGHWFPELTEAVKTQDFFKIPNTTIIQVPLPLLQLTKLDYMGLTKTSLEIADRFCEKAFSLDRQKEYFIKTGVFSSKYDFRNAHIQGAEEVRTIGEYLLFIHFQASSMAHFDLNGRNQPVIYGPGTTVEWVCREFIQDKEQNPCIYKGLPLHTEYVSVSAVECQDPKNSKNILWQKLCKRYEEMLPLSKNLTTELYPDWEHMTYPDVNSRCEDFARQNIANSYLTHLNAGQQMIPPHLLMPYVEESINYLQSEYGKNEYREKVQFLKKVFIDLNADDSIVRNIQPQFKTEEEPVINENTETDLEK